jgi:hypothetical protein
MEVELADLDEQLIAGQDPTQPHNLLSTLILSIVSFLFSVGCCYFALFSVSFRHGLVSSATEHAQLETECLKPLAVRYSLPDTVLFPTEINTSRWMRWASSLIYTLEAQFRPAGCLREYEYARFSADRYADNLVTFHKSSLSNFSKRIGRLYDSLIWGSPENIGQYSGAGYELPWIWPLIDSSSSRKPFQISGTISSISRYSGVETIKRAISSAHRPFPVSFRMPNTLFWIPNASSPTSCPSQTGNCSLHSFPPPTSILVDDPRGSFALGEFLTMAIVGFNDNFIISLPTGEQLKGGFVLRSGFNNNEHSSQYFFSALIDDQEEKLCPNLSNFAKWANQA